MTDEKEKRTWELCANEADEKKNWLCGFNKIKGKPCPVNVLGDNKLEIFKKTVIKQPLIIIPVPSPFCNEKWTYDSHGSDWECDCKDGKSQSPIDIPTNVFRFYNRTLFDFYPTSKDEKGEPLKIEFEDYKIKIKGRLGSLVSWSLIKYEIYEVQIHARSEHTINGKYYDIEMQFFYHATSSGCLRKSAAVAVLFKIVPGSKNLFFDKDINILDLPDSMEKKKILKKPIDLRHVFMTDEDDEYNGFSYYQYEGSLTSPPCQEDTTWFVVGKPVPISYTAVEYIKDTLRLQSHIEKNCISIDIDIEGTQIENYRNIQESCGRQVYYFENTCGVKKKKPEVKLGHFEKVKQEFTKYYYINENKPSGLPNSFVVSETEAKQFLLE